jgi:hypothetical protein
MLGYRPEDWNAKGKIKPADVSLNYWRKVMKYNDIEALGFKVDNPAEYHAKMIKEDQEDDELEQEEQEEYTVPEWDQEYVNKLFWPDGVPDDGRKLLNHGFYELDDRLYHASCDRPLDGSKVGYLNPESRGAKIWQTVPEDPLEFVWMYLDGETRLKSLQEGKWDMGMRRDSSGRVLRRIMDEEEERRNWRSLSHFGGEREGLLFDRKMLAEIPESLHDEVAWITRTILVDMPEPCLKEFICFVSYVKIFLGSRDKIEKVENDLAYELNSKHIKDLAEEYKRRPGKLQKVEYDINLITIWQRDPRFFKDFAFSFIRALALKKEENYLHEDLLVSKPHELDEGDLSLFVHLIPLLPFEYLYKNWAILKSRKRYQGFVIANNVDPLREYIKDNAKDNDNAKEVSSNSAEMTEAGLVQDLNEDEESKDASSYDESLVIKKVICSAEELEDNPTKRFVAQRIFFPSEFNDLVWSRNDHIAKMKEAEASQEAVTTSEYKIMDDIDDYEKSESPEKEAPESNSGEPIKIVLSNLPLNVKYEQIMALFTYSTAKPYAIEIFKDKYIRLQGCLDWTEEYSMYDFDPPEILEKDFGIEARSNAYYQRISEYQDLDPLMNPGVGIEDFPEPPSESDFDDIVDGKSFLPQYPDTDDERFFIDPNSQLEKINEARELPNISGRSGVYAICHFDNTQIAKNSILESDFRVFGVHFKNYWSKVEISLPRTLSFRCPWELFSAEIQELVYPYASSLQKSAEDMDIIADGVLLMLFNSHQDAYSVFSKIYDECSAKGIFVSMMCDADVFAASKKLKTRVDRLSSEIDPQVLKEEIYDYIADATEGIPQDFDSTKLNSPFYGYVPPAGEKPEIRENIDLKLQERFLAKKFSKSLSIKLKPPKPRRKR